MEGGGGVRGVGVDNCRDAIDLCCLNADRLGMRASTKWLCADFARLHEPEVRQELGMDEFNMVLLAPPESADHLWGAPKWEMRGLEPKSATVAGRTGLEGYSAVLRSIALCQPPLLGTLVHLLTQYPSTFSDTLPGLLAPDAWFIVRVLGTLVHLLTQYPSTFSDTLPGLLAPDAWFIVRVNSRSHHQVEGFRWFRLEALVFRV
jgi:hypothetical protein